MESRQIALFGGSFNPPHVCHTISTLWALQTQPIDEAWWIPTYQHAFGKSLVDYTHRRRMCELAIQPLGSVAISDIERELGGESRTIDTVRALEEKYPSADFRLVVGSDILEETDEWKQWDELVSRVELVVVGRSGYEADEGSARYDFELPNISSTDTRRAFQDGNREWLETWVPSAVLEYATEHDLYV